MSSVLSNPSRVVGIHFFNPAHVISTVEVIYGDKTSGEAVATAFSVCQAMKKVPVLVGNCPNFVFNRLLAVYLSQAHKLLWQYGMSPKDVDQIVTSFGFLMGPITMHDMNGLDIGAKVKQAHNVELNLIEKTLLDRNRLGRKNGT
uniref:3HCDH_N domain-containing protein n=1 Tax=Heterorhabditis bacteriophora TaxID=37862 RepID=A0A1I7X128_HETBA